MLRNKLLISTLFFAVGLTVSAQTGANSPQTRYGFGELSEPIFANNAAMGGIGYGLRSSSIINPLNPASYSAVDTLSFMFDAGLSLKSSNFSESGYKTNAKNASFDYLAMQFRLHPKLGMSIGYLPFSTVGYNFSFDGKVSGSEIRTTESFTGTGNIQQIYAGLGFKVFNNLSVGVNLGYLTGELSFTNTLVLTDPTTSASVGDQTIKYNKLNVNSYTLGFGAQYTHNLNKANTVTLGLTTQIGHPINVEEAEGTQMTDNASYSSTTENIYNDGYSLPMSYGIGGVWNHNKSWNVGLDYTFQNWAKAKHLNTNYSYVNRHKISIGGEYHPDAQSNNYLKQIRYRAGLFYSGPYTQATDGNKYNEMGVSFGFGFPLYLYQRRTMLNITGQYVRGKSSIADHLSVNRFELKLGLTFNEHWFMKWKVQ